MNIATQKPLSKLIIKNARIIDAYNDFIGSVVISEGVIQKIYKEGSEIADASSYQTFDATALAVMPAMVDLHCHFREPGYEYKEDILSGLRAAVKGGYCYVAAMANTTPIIDNTELILKNNTKAQKADLCAYNQISAIGVNLDDKILVDAKEISKLTKLFSNDGKSILSEEFMEKALATSREYNFIVATHCDDEAELIERDLKILSQTKGNLHICHVSKKQSVDLIRKAKADGLNVTCEITPHHLFSHDLDYKVNPPIGSKEDNEALIKAVKDGTIDILSSDHAPHSAEDKQKGSPGISNIETAFSMYIKVFKDNNISLKRFCEMSSYAPAKLMGFDGGIISEGKEANLIIADIENLYKIDKNAFISKSNNTPFDGYDVCGKVLATFIKGVVKYDSGQAL